MSKKGIRVDDFLEAMHDDRVTDFLAVRLMSSLTTMIEKIVETTFDKHVAAFTAKIEKLVEQAASEMKETCTNRHEAQSLKLLSLEQENTLLRLKVDELDNLSRLNNLVIHGLPETTDNTSTDGKTASSRSTQQITTILDLCNDHLNLQVRESDISCTYRLPIQGFTNHRPLVVGFTNRRIRDAVLGSRKLLRINIDKSRIFINEHLTRINSMIFARARRLVKAHTIHSAWTAGGRVFLKKNPDQLYEKPLRVDSITIIKTWRFKSWSL